MRCLCLAVVLAAWAAGAAAAETASVYLEELTSPEVGARLQAGTDTILIPTGGTEQNGDRLTLGKHNDIVHYTAGKIATALGNALVAPVIAYVPEGPISPPQGHMRFPGTISVSEEHFAGILEDAARSFKQHGFKRICFIGDSGGNQAAQARVAAKLTSEWKGEGVTVLHVASYYEDKEGLAWAKAHGGGENPAEHAGFMDSAELMAANAGAVRGGGANGTGAKNGQSLLSFKIKAAAEAIKTCCQ